MKRFIDIRYQDIADARFAWYDTVVDEFETHSDSQVWNTWAEFKEDYEGNEIERYRTLCPPWSYNSSFHCSICQGNLKTVIITNIDKHYYYLAIRCSRFNCFNPRRISRNYFIEKEIEQIREIIRGGINTLKELFPDAYFELQKRNNTVGGK